jgi:hypothetical protein
LGKDLAWVPAGSLHCEEVIIYRLSLSNALGIDISEAVLGKLGVNERRYPVAEFRARFRKPERER